MLSLRSCSLLFLILLTSFSGFCQLSSDYKDAIEQSKVLIKEQLQTYPGISIAVTIGNEVAWSEGFGLADREKATPVTDANTFRLYSLSKTITGLAVAKLEEDGKLDLSKNISFYLPDVPAAYKDVKVYHLVSHTAGVRHYKNNEWLKVSSKHCDNAADADDVFINDKLESVPGTKYQYSSFGYVLLSQLLEKAAGVPFRDYVRENIFKSTGVKLYFDKVDPYDNPATFYEAGKKIKVAREIDNSCKFGGGSINGSAADVAKLFSGVFYSGMIINQASATKTLESFKLDDGTPVNYGYGWQRIKSSEGYDIAIHTGSGLGGSSAICFLPEKKLMVVMTTNLDEDDFYKTAIAIAKKFAPVVQ